MREQYHCSGTNCVRFIARGHSVIGACLIFLFYSLCHSQSVPPSPQTDEIQDNITKIDRGQIDNVKKILPDLIAKYQNTPGILYLQGRLASDGIEGVKFYQSVVDNFPKSEYADDALYRIYQYYYAIGLYKTADLKLQQLKKEYPHSPHISGTTAVTIPHEEEPAVNVAKKDTLIADTQKINDTGSVSAKPTPTPVPVTITYYTLQVGAFSTVSNAEKQKGFFDDLGYTTEITNKVRNGRSLYLVWVGNFKTAGEAMQLGKEVKAKYKIMGIVVEKY
jgi:hypothetical protein